MADERVSHEKREGNCRIVYFESPTLWNHEDCPICRAEQAERERDEAKPVLEAARYQAMIHGSKIAYREACYQTELAISSFDAARAAKGGEGE